MEKTASFKSLFREIVSDAFAFSIEQNISNTKKSGNNKAKSNNAEEDIDVHASNV